MPRVASKRLVVALRPLHGMVDEHTGQDLGHSVLSQPFHGQFEVHGSVLDLFVT